MLLCTKRQIASIFRSTQGSLKRSILSTINQKLFLSVSYTSRFICGKNKQTPPHLRPSGEKSRKPLPERKVAANRAAIRPEEIWVCEKKSSTNAELTIKYLAVIFNFLRSRDLIVQGDVRTVLKFAERSWAGLFQLAVACGKCETGLAHMAAWRVGCMEVFWIFEILEF